MYIYPYSHNNKYAFFFAFKNKIFSITQDTNTQLFIHNSISYTYRENIISHKLSTLKIYMVIYDFYSF